MAKDNPVELRSRAREYREAAKDAKAGTAEMLIDLADDLDVAADEIEKRSPPPNVVDR